MPRDERLYLDDILDSIAQIREYCADMSYHTFTQDRKTQDAVVRNLEIIGEAVRRLPETCKERANDIEWRKNMALRNILAHEYFGVSLPVVWDVVQHKLGRLETTCMVLMAELDGNE
jgi:uncharacterized protein with HEPN domain